MINGKSGRKKKEKGGFMRKLHAARGLDRTDDLVITSDTHYHCDTRAKTLPMMGNYYTL